MCYTKLKEREIPSQFEDMHQELTLVFMGHLRPKQSSLVLNESSIDFYEKVFPFCEQCEKVVTKLHQNYTQLQSSLKRIKRVMTTVRSQIILNELVNFGPVRNAEITMDTEVEKQFEQDESTSVEPRGEHNLNDGPKSDSQEATDRVTCEPGTKSSASAGTLGTVIGEAQACNRAETSGK